MRGGGTRTADGVTLVSMCGLLNYCLQPLLIWQLRRREVDQLDFRSKHSISPAPPTAHARRESAIAVACEVSRSLWRPRSVEALVFAHARLWRRSRLLHQQWLIPGTTPQPLSPLA
jgi:hypothetical protein